MRRIVFIFLMTIAMSVFCNDYYFGQTIFNEQNFNFETFEHWDQSNHFNRMEHLNGYEEVCFKLFKLDFDDEQGYQFYLNYLNENTTDIIMQWSRTPSYHKVTLYRKIGSNYEVSLDNFMPADAHL